MSAKLDTTPHANLETATHESTPAISQHVLNECNISCAPGKKGAANTDEAREAKFMAEAPALARKNLGLSDKASSHAFVDKYINATVDAYKQRSEHATEQDQRSSLTADGFDQQTTGDIVAHKKGWEKEMASSLLDKEKQYLQIPGKITTESDYKRLETGILHDAYTAIRDTEKVVKFMKDSQEMK